MRYARALRQRILEVAGGKPFAAGEMARLSVLSGEGFAAARREFERRWGCRNLEVTVGDLCETAAFARFACHLLSELPRFHATYNDVLAAYNTYQIIGTVTEGMENVDAIYQAAGGEELPAQPESMTSVSVSNP